MFTRRWRHALRRFLVKLLLVGALAFVGTVWYLHRYGVPDSVLRRVLHRASQGAWAVEAAGLELGSGPTLTFKEVRIYPKRRVAPPLLEARWLNIELDLQGALQGRGWVRRLTVTDGVFRPEVLSPPFESYLVGRVDGILQYPLDVVGERLNVNATSVQNLEVTLRREGACIQLDPLRLAVRHGLDDGRLTGKVEIDLTRRVIKADLEGTLVPSLILAWLKTYPCRPLETLLNRLHFETPPRLRLKACHGFGNAPQGELDVRFELGQGTYRAVAFRHADGRARVLWSPRGTIVTLEPLLVAREEGTVTGGFTVDVARKLVDFDMASTLDPAALFGMIGVLPNPFTHTVRCHGPVRLYGGGWLDYSTGARTDFEAFVSARQVAWTNLVADECSFTLEGRGRQFKLRDLRGSAYGGTFEGSAVFTMPPAGETGTLYTLDLRVAGWRFEEVLKLGPSGSKPPPYYGQLTGWLRLQGITPDPTGRRLRGEGRIEVDQGRVFLLPVFGGLSQILTRIVPGLDFILRQTDAQSSFTIQDGKLHAESIAIEGDVLSLHGRGDYFWDRRLDFHVQVTFLKKRSPVGRVVQLLTHPLSKLFEFRLRGTLGDPRWYPVNFSPDVLEKVRLRSPEDR